MPRVRVISDDDEDGEELHPRARPYDRVTSRRNFFRNHHANARRAVQDRPNRHIHFDDDGEIMDEAGPRMRGNRDFPTPRARNIENQHRGFLGAAEMEQENPEPEPQAAGGNQHQSGIGTTMIHRGPRNNMITADGLKFKKLYKFVINTSKPMYWKSSQDYGIHFPGIYCFDPAEPMMYFDINDIVHLRQLCNYRTDAAPYATAKAKNALITFVKGRLTNLGPGAPFVTGTTAQAATNSQIVMTYAKATGLEDKLAVKLFECKKDATSIEINNVKQINTALDQIDKHVDSGWSLYQSDIYPTLAAGINQITGNASYQYRVYDKMAGFPNTLGNPRATSTITDITEGYDRCPDFMPHMTEEDVKSPNVFRFNYDTNCFLTKQDELPGAQTTATARTSRAGHQSTYGIRTSQQLNVDTNVDYDSYKSRTQDTLTMASFKKGRIVMNNSVINGQDHTHRPSLLKKEYLFPIAPPTIDESVLQDVNMYLELEVEAGVALRWDPTYGAAHACSFMAGHVRGSTGTSTILAETETNVSYDSVYGVPGLMFGNGELKP